MSLKNKVSAILSNKQGFVRNMSILTFCNILVNVINLFTNMYLARVLKPSLYGEYGVFLSYAGILSTISALGLQQVVIRGIAQHQDNSVAFFKISIIARLLGFLSTSVIFILYTLYAHEFDGITLVLLLGYVLVLSGWDGVQNVAFGMQRMEYTGYINMFGAAFILLTYILLPSDYVSVKLVICVLAFFSLLKLILYLIKCWKEGLFTHSNHLPEESGVISLIKESSPFFALSVLTLFTTQIPVLFLANNSGTHEVAFFNTANKIMVPISITLNTMMAALFPNIAKEVQSNSKRCVQKIIVLMRFIVFSGAFICIILTLFRNEIVWIIYGSEYANTGMVMATQCWYLVFHAIFCLFGTVWAAVKKDKVLAVMSVLYAIVNTSVLWPMSHYGATWLSIGYIIGCFINMPYHFYFFKNSIPNLFTYQMFFKLMGILVLGIAFSIAFPVNCSILIRIAITAVLLLSVWLVKDRIISALKVNREQIR